MTGLSEVSILIGQRTRDIEKAREIFTAEIRSFVSGVLGAVQRTRNEPWTASRVRIDLPNEVDFESKSSGALSSQFAVARLELRFKKGVKFGLVAEVRFGVEFDDKTDAFAWQMTLVPASKYNLIDNVIWHQWKTQATVPPDARHRDKANTVQFLSRPLSPELTGETAFNDVKGVLEFLLTMEPALVSAVGLGDD